MLRLVFNFFVFTGALDEALDYIHDLEAKLQNTGLPPPTLFSRYCSSDDQIRFYTKFSSESDFTIFWESIAPSALNHTDWCTGPKHRGQVRKAAKIPAHHASCH